MSKKLHFTKMHGSGNDFIIVDNSSGEYSSYLDSDAISKLCARHLGVGADGYIEIQKGNLTKFKYIQRDKDGSRLGMCGNGSRCFFRFLVDKYDIDPNIPYDIETETGIITLQLDNQNNVLVMMGQIEFIKEGSITIRGEANYNYTFLHIGGYPHCVIFLKNKLQRKKVPLQRHGSTIEQLKDIFPDGTNVEFSRFDGDEFYSKVRERNIGKTRACGKGSCATIVAGSRLGLTNHKKNIINLWGGKLTIQRSGNWDDPIYLSGPAKYVYKGEINLE